MKALWLCNIILPEVMESLGKKPTPTGGWLTGMLEGMMNYEKDVSVDLCMPCSWTDSVISSKTERGGYYLFPCKRRDIYNFNIKTEGLFEQILLQSQPDIVHIWGTEFPYALSMVNACEKLGLLGRAVINVQGLVSIYALHYCASIPWRVAHDFFTPRHLIFRDWIARQKGAFERRGKYEIEALCKVKHVIGRTDWDRACITQINPKINYHSCNEILRRSFYKHAWDFEKCERYSIFVSQGSYPIKGLHFVLKAMPLILRQYPSARLYVAGPDVTCSSGSIKERLKLTAYGKYIKKLIKRHGLEGHVSFCGQLDEEQMRERYLNSHVFISVSSIENSSNSICEAMLLGMPVVSSDVGGVKNLLEHNKEGFIYQHDAPYMLAFYVSKIFGSSNIAVKIGHNAKLKANTTHNCEVNVKTTIEIYRNISDIKERRV